MAQALLGWLKRELTRNPKRKIGALLARNAFRTIARRMDPDAYGGAPLLGINGHVMKAHGSARERAIMNAIRVTKETIQHQISHLIRQKIAQANERLAEAKVTGPALVSA